VLCDLSDEDGFSVVVVVVVEQALISQPTESQMRPTLIFLEGSMTILVSDYLTVDVSSRFAEDPLPEIKKKKNKLLSLITGHHQAENLMLKTAGNAVFAID
jgi:hypothetical protein